MFYVIRRRSDGFYWTNDNSMRFSEDLNDVNPLTLKEAREFCNETEEDIHVLIPLSLGTLVK